MTKQKENPYKFWTVELNIGQKRNMGKLKHSKSSGYRYDFWNLKDVHDRVVKRFDAGSGNTVKAMFQFNSTYKDEPETSFYMQIQWLGDVETFKEESGLQGEYMAYADRKILEDKLLILCMELEQECIAYNIKEWTSSTFYPTGKQDLIYHPNYTEEQMIFDDEYFYTFEPNKLSHTKNLFGEHVTNTETVG